MNRTSVLALLLACSGGAVAQEPEWLQTMRAREAGPSARMTEIRSPDGWFSARVPARLLGKIEPGEEAYAVNLEIAPNIIANCQVSKGAVDLSSLLSLGATSAFALLEQQNGKIARRGVERTDAGHIDGHAYLAVDWIYNVETDKGPLVGSLKQMVANRQDVGLYCLQSDIGYARTFDGLMRAFVQSLQVKEEPPPAAYAEVSVVSLGAAKIGVATATVKRDADEGLRVDMQMSLVLPVTPETLRTQDTYAVQFTAADGSMVNALHVVANNGEIESNLKLVPREEGGWQVTGQHMGKELDGTIEAAHDPTTFIRQARVRKALLEAADPTGAESVEWQWIAADPLRLTEARVKVAGAAGEGLYRASESAGALKLESIIERASGLTQRADFAIGGKMMTAERVFSRGGF